MTARRRRKSGSGPSATALIAWVGGVQAGFGAPTGAPASVIPGGPSGRMPSGGRAILVARACGLAAGTLLACGSVLAGATHVGDGSLAGDSAPLLNHTPAAPGTGSGALDEYRGQAHTERASAAPDLVRAQAVAETSSALHPRLGQVRRNDPASLDVPAEPPRQSRTAPRPWDSPPPATGHAPTGPIAPVSPVLDPAAKGVGRVAPVGGVLAPSNPGEERTGSPHDEQRASLRAERTSPSTIEAVARVTRPVAPVTRAVAPLRRAVAPLRRAVAPPHDNATQPAMVMLTSLLPIG
jgi:hypothetical protein